MSRNQLLLGLASVLIAASIVVIAIDVDEESSTLAPVAPTPPPEEQAARLMRIFVSAHHSRRSCARASPNWKERRSLTVAGGRPRSAA